MDLELIQRLKKKAESKIVLLVMDGLGGLPREPGGRTELETARTPHLDNLADQSICGLQTPVGTAITPGSGPGHLGLFGYDPLKYEVGRGVLSALGVDFDLRHGDVASRGNFCTVDDSGVITDRRAGRIPTEECRKLCEKLNTIEIPGVELFVKPVKEYRFLLVMRGKDLSGEIEDTDPHQTGEMPLPVTPRSEAAKKTADLVSQFVKKASEVLKDSSPANMLLLRGFAQRPDWPSFEEVYGLNAAAIAAYPMYRGISRLLGLEILDTGNQIDDEFHALEKHWKDFDFFYVHIKPIDSAGEDGDFDRKVQLIEKVDEQIPRLMKLHPDVVMVTGDHSTPAVMKSHGYHPVPVLLFSKVCRPDKVGKFGERECMAGGLGPRFPGKDLMPLAMANAMRLDKFGA